jgi:hypothetical protein
MCLARGGERRRIVGLGRLREFDQLAGIEQRLAVDGAGEILGADLADLALDVGNALVDQTLLFGTRGCAGSIPASSGAIASPRYVSPSSV